MVFLAMFGISSQFPVLHLIRSFEYSNNNFIGFVVIVLGFKILNFPLENFYGNGGAYVLGH